MNLVDCYVTAILGKPYFKYKKYWLDVEYNSYGQTDVTQLMFNTKAEAEQITVGYKFLA